MRAVTLTPIDGWSPDQYERFRSQRQQPFDDLLMLCQPVPGGGVVDLGCGTGDLTKVLHEEMQAKETVGIDSSPTMLARAPRVVPRRAGSVLRPQATSPPGSVKGSIWSSPTRRCNGSTTTSTSWRACARRWPPTGSWPSRCRRTTATRRTSWRTPWPTSPVHRRPRGDAPEDRGRFVLSPELYADLLYELGAKDQVVRMEVYGHELESTERGGRVGHGHALTPYRKRLSPSCSTQFVERYRERLVEELGEREPYFYGFRRILCWARFG